MSEPGRPLVLALRVCNEVLSNLDAHMGKASRFTMRGYCVVRFIGHRVGLVLACVQAIVLTQQLQQRAAQPPVLAIHEADFPRTRLAQVNRREAVHGNQQSASAGDTALLQNGADRRVVRREDFRDARRCFDRRQAFIGGDADISLRVGIELADPGGRLQSITRRE